MTPTRFFALALAASLALVACSSSSTPTEGNPGGGSSGSGSGKSGGSGSGTATGSGSSSGGTGGSYCVTGSGSTQTCRDSGQASCASTVSHCPSADLEGCCTLSIAGMTSVTCWYDASSSSADEAACTAGSGTWSTTAP